MRVTGYDAVVPLYKLEEQYMPGEDKIRKAVEETLKY
jgi:pyruvate dehydrogenase E1 component beta subunit